MPFQSKPLLHQPKPSKFTEHSNRFPRNLLGGPVTLSHCSIPGSSWCFQEGACRSVSSPPSPLIFVAGRGRWECREHKPAAGTRRAGMRGWGNAGGRGCGSLPPPRAGSIPERSHPGAAASPGASTMSSTNAHPLFRFKALARRHFSQLQPPAMPVLQEAAVKNSFLKGN